MGLRGAEEAPGAATTSFPGGNEVPTLGETQGSCGLQPESRACREKVNLIWVKR